MKPIKDKSGVTGRLKVVKTNAQGVTTQEFEVPNLVVNSGLAFIAQRMVDQGATQHSGTHSHPSQMTHMALGSDNTTPIAGHTTLIDEHGRVELATDGTSVEVSGATVTFTATFPGGTATGFDHTAAQVAGTDPVGYDGGYDSAKDGSIKEAGIFSASSGGTMLCRTVFLPVNKEHGDSITITWVVTIS